MKWFFRFTIRQVVVLTATVAGCVAMNRGNDPRDVVYALVNYPRTIVFLLLSFIPFLMIGLRLFQKRGRTRSRPTDQP